MLAGLVFLSFGYFGEVIPFCTKFVKICIAVYALFGLIDHGPVMNNARSLHLGTESRCIWFCLSSARPPLVPYFMRAPPFQVGFGPCVLRWALFSLGFSLVQALPSSPASSGLGLFPSASAFSFPLPFQGSPAPGKVCWCWCSLLVPPLLFCVPRLVFLLSNFHPIFISLSFPCHPHLHLTAGTSVFDPAWRGVCVEHLNRCKTSIQYQTCRGAVVHSAVTA